MEATRVDRWLYAVRVLKTRASATEACRAGHVTLNGSSAKASSLVHAGDRLRVRLGGSERLLEVVTVLDRRVSATVAATCLIDSTPKRPAGELAPGTFVRDRAAGRPTKRERRDLDSLRGRLR